MFLFSKIVLGLTEVQQCLQQKFGVRSIRLNPDELTAAVYLQVSIVSQALIFVTRSRSWSFLERPGFLLVTAFIVAQLVSSYYIWFIHLQGCFIRNKFNYSSSIFLVSRLPQLSLFMQIGVLQG